jgi:dihydroxyacid dehydratase/phosphogluconate dehydratase
MTPAATLPSRRVTVGMHNALNRIYFHAMGLTRDDLDGRPMVGVGTAWHGAAAAGDLPLQAASAAEEGVWSGGATPRQFATIAEVDGGAGTLHPGLVTREIVADSVELTVRGHAYDALVGIGATPLSLAGLMLAMCRLDVPAVLVPLVGDGFGGDDQGRALALVAETLELALPPTAAADTVAAGMDAARAAGAAIAARLASGVTPRTLVTRTALLQAAARLGERDADPALVLHLAALAAECGVALSLGDAARAMGEAVGGPAWVAGTLAPDGALLRGPAVSAGGRAQVFDGQEGACAWLERDGWPTDRVLVVRHQGPVGSPGMATLDALAQTVARTGAPAGAVLITDGLVPPIHGVTCVMAAGPEAAAGGPLALIRDGDAIAVDPGQGTADVADLTGRIAPVLPPPRPLGPVLEKYRRTVGPAAGGAMTHPGAAAEVVRYADV